MTTHLPGPGLQGLEGSVPEPTSSPEADGTTARLLREDVTLPLVIEPAAAGVDLAGWVRLHRALVDQHLARHGALLWRGFGIDSIPKFEALSLAICAELYDENGEHEMVSGNVAVPVFYPKEKQLLWHNENSFNHVWPRRILFCCAEPAARGGETPIVDSRAVYERLPERLRQRFAEKGVMYQRNYGSGAGLDWRVVFRTDRREEVEAKCRASRTACEWQPDDCLRTRAVRPAVIPHPVTGELSWFNQAQHWHISCLDVATREALLALFDEPDLPRHCYLGDGSPIAGEEMETILATYQELEVRFPWEKGDVMVVDNVLAAHGRNPFEGNRKILVTMGDMMSFDEI